MSDVGSARISCIYGSAEFFGPTAYAYAYAVSKPPTNITKATIAPTTTKNITKESHVNAAFRSMSKANSALRASSCNHVARVAFHVTYPEIVYHS